MTLPLEIQHMIQRRQLLDNDSFQDQPKLSLFLAHLGTLEEGNVPANSPATNWPHASFHFQYRRSRGNRARTRRLRGWGGDALDRLRAASRHRQPEERRAAAIDGDGARPVLDEVRKHQGRARSRREDQACRPVHGREKEEISVGRAIVPIIQAGAPIS
jgi:hypothetical protein